MVTMAESDSSAGKSNSDNININDKKYYSSNIMIKV